MGWFITACIVAFIALILFGASRLVQVPEKSEGEDFYGRQKEEYEKAVSARHGGAFIAIALGVISIILAGVGSFYNQQEGEGVVLRSITGEVIGQTYDSGLHPKAPWSTTERWDLRENTVSYVGNGESSYGAGSVEGPRITVQDRDGVRSNVDITVRYSIDGDRISDLFASFGTQESVTTKVIEPVVRSAVRKVPGTYSTLELVLERAEIEQKVHKNLKEEWAKYGITVDGINMQEFVLPDSVNKSYEAKAAAIASVDRQKAENLRQDEANKQRIDNAVAEAKANREISESLTDDLLALRQIEAYGEGTMYIVPEGSTPFISPGK